MSYRESISDERLGAYLDGELDAAECESIREALKNDPEVASRLAELQRVRDLLQLAYDDIEPRTKRNLYPVSIGARAVAAMLLVAVGALIGAILHYELGPVRTPSHASLGIQAPGGPEAGTAGAWRVVMHMNTTDPYVQKTLLDETENLLKSFRDHPQAVQVEIVAYGPGVDFLVDGESPYASRIGSLQEKYPSLSFTVCGRTIKRLAETRGHDIKLLPHTYVAGSGIGRIIERQKEGWHYIRL